jgi:hypothetical protein
VGDFKVAIRVAERKAAAAFIKESNDLVDSIMRGVSTF